MSIIDELYELYSNSTKIKVFLSYIESNYKINDYAGLLKNISEEDILNSLNFYIKENKVGYQITADNYISDLTKFFERLSSSYNIKNNLFINKEKYNSMVKSSKIIIGKLKEGEFKEIANYEEINKVEKYIEEELEEISEFDLIDDVSSRTLENNKRTAKFNIFISIIATKLTIQYGIKNKIIVDLKINDYNQIYNELTLNGLNLSLTEDYKELFQMYLNARKVVLEKYNLNTEDLFIKGHGDRIKGDKGVADYSTLFTVLYNVLGSRGTEKFAYRKIIELIEKGIDILTISRLTGFSESTCLRLLEYYNNDILKIDISKILKVINNDRDAKENIASKIQPQNYIKCPCCGNIVESVSTNWILVQYENNPEKYLVCKGCKGIDKKDNL